MVSDVFHSDLFAIFLPFYSLYGHLSLWVPLIFIHSYFPGSSPRFCPTCFFNHLTFASLINISPPSHQSPCPFYPTGTFYTIPYVSFHFHLFLHHPSLSTSHWADFLLCPAWGSRQSINAEGSDNVTLSQSHNMQMHFWASQICTILSLWLDSVEMRLKHVWPLLLHFFQWEGNSCTLFRKELRLALSQPLSDSGDWGISTDSCPGVVKLSENLSHYSPWSCALSLMVSVLLSHPLLSGTGHSPYHWLLGSLPSVKCKTANSPPVRPAVRGKTHLVIVAWCPGDCFSRLKSKG